MYSRSECGRIHTGGVICESVCVVYKPEYIQAADFRVLWYVYRTFKTCFFVYGGSFQRVNCNSRSVINRYVCRHRIRAYSPRLSFTAYCP